LQATEHSEKMKIKVISLDRTPERRQKFRENNPDLSFDFFSAIDGAILPGETVRDEQIFSKPNLLVGLGAYGCALSHRSLWAECIGSGEPITILEDDAILRKDFQVTAQRMLSEAPQNWDLVVWGWNFDNILKIEFESYFSSANIRFDEAHLQKNLNSFKGSVSPSNLYKLVESWGTPAYSISPAGAEKFRSLCFPLRGVYGIDHAMNKHFRSVNAMVAFPPLAVTPNKKSDSTVQPPIKREGIKKLIHFVERTLWSKHGH
jgi:glycosyl transferase, family 25